MVLKRCCREVGFLLFSPQSARVASLAPAQFASRGCRFHFEQLQHNFEVALAVATSGLRAVDIVVGYGMATHSEEEEGGEAKWCM